MLIKKPGAGRRDRTDILSLEGCCTTIVLYPRSLRSAARSGLRRVVGEAGLEPAKLTQRIYSPPPLPLGTFPQRVENLIGRPGRFRRTGSDVGRKASASRDAWFRGAPDPENPRGPKSERVL